MHDTALLSGPAQPAWLVAKLSERLFRHIHADESWQETMGTLSARGSVVHVLRSPSLVDLLTLNHFARTLNLPQIGFANDLGHWLSPLAISSGKATLPDQALRDTLHQGGSAVIFLRRSKGVLERTLDGGDRADGNGLLKALVAMGRDWNRGRITLVPETIVWTQRPERRGLSLVDTVFGSADVPGDLRAIVQFLANYKHCVVRAAEPIDLHEFLETAQALGDDDSDTQVARRLGYALLRRVERERRTILGPLQKTPDRVIDEVLRSPKLLNTLNDLAGPGESERRLLRHKARTMLRKLSATPDAETVKGLEMILDTLVERVYAGVDVDQEGLSRLRDAARRGSVVLLPSHKSHVDYLLLSYILRKNALQIPMIAAGENLAFFPMGPIFRRSGAFFIRRSFKGDKLYAAVLDAYVRRLMRDGFPIEFFLEGGRSRTGKLLPPKVGLLSMVVDAAMSLEGRPVTFLPVSIGYERMMEEGAYARELAGGAKNKEDARGLLKIGGILREKYGRANVQFGAALDLGEFRKKHGLDGAELLPPERKILVTRLAHHVMSEVNRVTQVTPGSLVATVLLSSGKRGLPHAELVLQCERLLRLLRRWGARTAPSLTLGNGELRPSVIRETTLLYARAGILRQHVRGEALSGQALKRAKIYTGEDVIYEVPHERRMLLDLAKNIIVHLFVDRALVSLAYLSPTRGNIVLSELRERVRSLSKLFKFEFMFRADAPFEEIFEQTIADMCKTHELAVDRDVVRFGEGHDNCDGRSWVVFYAGILRNFVEGYRIAARAIKQLVRGPLSERDLVTRALRLGEEMFLGGEIERSEAVSRPVLENAVAVFVEQGYLVRSDGKVMLAESFLSDEAAQAVEAKIASYLLRRSTD